MSWYLLVLKKYAIFEGRSRRKEYWYFTLFDLLFTQILRLVDAAAGTAFYYGLGVLSGLYSLAVLIPAIAVGIRRLHDTNRSGWWLLLGYLTPLLVLLHGLWRLLSLVLLIATITLTVFLARDGDTGENRYGANPRTSAVTS